MEDVHSEDITSLEEFNKHSNERNNNQASNSDDEDVPSLSPFTLATLQEFLSSKTNLLDSQRLLAGNPEEELFAEDWQLSQFWYTQETSDRIANEAIGILSILPEGNDSKIACLSTPSVFRTLKKMCPNGRNYFLFEIDTRFQFFGDQFIFYDYKYPVNIPKKFYQAFDIIIADLPFLSDECLEKYSQTISFLSRNSCSCLLILTGAILEPLVHSRFANMRTLHFKPTHRNNLQNDFACFANYQPIRLE